MTSPNALVSSPLTNLPQMEASEFAAISDYAKENFGLHLVPAKKEMVYARLIKRLRKMGMSDFFSYLEHIKKDQNADERSEFLSALTTNVTQFFREGHHFSFLKDSLLPKLIAKARMGNKVRIWSAGCSAGQEPYSLAMTVLDRCPEVANLDFKILATDIDPRILETAQTGIYPREQLGAIPADLHRMTVLNARGDAFSIADNVRKLVSFAELNLIGDWPMRLPFEVIFCRNVAIYFDAQTQSRLWGRFAQHMAAGGHLFIGHSERLSGPAATSMKSVGVTVYTNQISPQNV